MRSMPFIGCLILLLFTILAVAVIEKGQNNFQYSKKRGLIAPVCSMEIYNVSVIIRPRFDENERRN